MAFVRLNVYGRIPAGTVCPYKDHCFAAHNNACVHDGLEHPTDHDCISAKMADYVQYESDLCEE